MNFLTIVWPTKLREGYVLSRVRISVCCLEGHHVTTTHDVCWSVTGTVGTPPNPSLTPSPYRTPPSDPSLTPLPYRTPPPDPSLTPSPYRPPLPTQVSPLHYTGPWPKSSVSVIQGLSLVQISILDRLKLVHLDLTIQVHITGTQDRLGNGQLVID